jgi:5'-methylthioadenosine phosphorylase
MSRVGVIGGSALYELENIVILKKKRVTTPFGDPSDEITIGKIHNRDVCFLPRHSRGHKTLPSEINNRANIYALKKLGVDVIVSVSAVGSLKENIKPMDIVLIDQFVDRTNCARNMTFFGNGIVAHIPFAEPICPSVRETIYKSNKGIGAKIHDGGTYVNIEGPAFSTRAESYLYKSWGMDVIGMTNLPEAKLSREAGICYATIAMVTDYDCWSHDTDIETVSVELIIETLMKNIEVAKKMVANTIKALPEKRACRCGNALGNAVITDKNVITEEVKKKLDVIIAGHID